MGKFKRTGLIWLVLAFAAMMVLAVYARDPGSDPPEVNADTVTVSEPAR